MEIIVNNKTRLSSIQDEFTDAFRYLKLEFAASQRNSQTNGLTVADVSKIRSTSSLMITPAMTTKKLKDQFLECYGLPVQVMRRFGNTWVEATVTDGWTLEEQNKQGERLSKHHSG